MKCLGAQVLGCLGALVLAAGCSDPASPAAEQAPTPSKDAQHAGITTPHGDHSPHHGGLVLMNGEVHYEVVLDRAGQHRIWFSDAVREDLPASIATRVVIVMSRPGAAPEELALSIDDNGESWVAAGAPVAGDDVMVKVSFVARGQPFEVELPFLVSAK